MIIYFIWYTVSDTKCYILQRKLYAIINVFFFKNRLFAESQGAFFCSKLKLILKSLTAPIEHPEGW